MTPPTIHLFDPERRRRGASPNDDGDARDADLSTQPAAAPPTREAASPRRGEGLRILHLIGSADPRAGGPAEGVIRHCEALQGELATLDPADAPFLADAPVTVHALGPAGETWRDETLRMFGWSPRLEPWLRRNVRNYDCVIVHGIWDYAAVAAARVLPGLGAPYFVFTHGTLDQWLRRRYPITHAQRQLSWLLFQGPLLQGARRVFFTTESERVCARNALIGFNDYRGEVVSYGAADVAGDRGAQIRAFRAAAPALGERPYLLFRSPIHPDKGCDLLVKAFAWIALSQPDLHLVIAGPDPIGWSAELKRIAARDGVAKRVHWPGLLSGDLKWGAFRGAEAYVLPSHRDNFAMGVAEALACATPVLITDRVDTWREVQAAGAGFVAADDQAGVDRLLQRWTTLDNLSRARMSVAARTCFQRHFDVTESAASLQKSIEASL